MTMSSGFGYIGELAALGTAICWTFGSQFFEAAGKRIGSISVNMLRLIMAFVFFSVLSMITTGWPIPGDLPVHAWIWLGLSGIVGFALGDLFLFYAFIEIGPRISMLLMTMSAPLSAVFGRIFLKEAYSTAQWLGIFITLAGISWVILERPGAVPIRRRVRVLTKKGIIAALLGALGQAGGYVLSKYGMEVNGGFIDPFAATQIRVIAGILGFAVIITFLGRWGKVKQAVLNRAAVGFLSAGAFLGPFLGVSLSLLALQYITAGVAATILSLAPIFIIPSVIIFGKEHVSFRAFLGAIIAVGGVIILTLSK